MCLFVFPFGNSLGYFNQEAREISSYIYGTAAKKTEVCCLLTTFQAQLNSSSDRKQFLVYGTGVYRTMMFLVRPVYTAYLFMAFVIDGTSIFDDIL